MWICRAKKTSRVARREGSGHLFLDVRHLRLSQVEGLLSGLAGYRLQLGVAEGEPQQRDRKAVDQQQGRDVRAGQQLKERAESID